MELRQEYEDAVDHLRRKLDEALDNVEYWLNSYEDLLRDFHRVCDERADLEARVQEFEFAIQRDKDGDGYINKECMNELFPDTTEGEP